MNTANSSSSPCGVMRPKNTSARPLATMIPPVKPTPIEFCTSTNTGQNPLTPNSTHCTAIHALFVHTLAANEACGLSE